MSRCTRYGRTEPHRRYRLKGRVTFPSSDARVIGEKCANYVQVANELAESYSPVQWSKELKPWIGLVESGRRAFGDTWAMFVLAYTSAGVRDSRDPCSDAKELFDESIELCRRAR